MVGADILAFLLILRVKHSINHHLASFLVVGFSYVLSVKLRKLPSIQKPAKSFNDKQVLNFVKSYFCIYLSDHMLFLFSVNMLTYTDSLKLEKSVEPPLYSWDSLNSHGVLSFYILLDCNLLVFSIVFPIECLHLCS